MSSPQLPAGSDEPREPRTWLPIAIAAGIAVLAIVGALISYSVRARLDPMEQAAVDACEAEYAEQAPTGPRIVGGEVFSTAEWPEYLRTLQGYNAGPVTRVADMTEDEIAARDAEAAAMTEDGGEVLTVVWTLSDDSHQQCVATFASSVLVGDVVVGELPAEKKDDAGATGDATEEPSPSPQDGSDEE